MEHGLKLGAIPENAYSDYKYDVIFNAYKWDPQIGDQNTIAKNAVLMEPETASKLEQWAEQLSVETMRMEESLIHRLPLAGKLGLPKKIQAELHRLKDYDRGRNVRLMRFDFHPTENGWAVSEVNSDVPGGLAEASVLPGIASRHFDGYAPRGNVGETILDAWRDRIKKGGAVALVHATSYSDDRQVMQFLGDLFEHRGYRVLYAAPDHIRWVDRKAHSIIPGFSGELDGVIRFFPLEWLINLPKKTNWPGYFECQTPACNHATAILTQSKRLPLVWDELGVDVPVWKQLLPQTKDPKSLSLKNPDNDWIFKPALGRVGEGISIKGAETEKIIRSIEKSARRRPVDWVAQRMFKSCPLPGQDGQYWHLCIGVFTVDGKSAGFYGRAGLLPRIDANAVDIPVLVEGG